ncbi:PepSY domain-containing protein [Streptomyces sp. RerS4]|uniref:PepSY domain-containing protein n=1 Tax=Streptomyces sp. RerS4 TaxID=2942449 RepID=UPI00201C1E22|nr:PepSY domain-containing protein [Streptomyces sp. RerS4]UQX03040.1 PepSY domain-containing protein [Streptomyces sp. RerS4]
MKRKRTPYVAAAASLALVVAGPLAATAAGAPTTAPAAVSGAVTVTLVAIDAQGAAEAAVKAFPGKIESLDKVGPIWHVDVISDDGKSHAGLELDANGGVLRKDVETGRDPGEAKRLKDAATDAPAAIKAALAAHRGEVTSVDFDDDADQGSKPHWNVEIKGADGKDRSIDVDAKTGKVTGSDADDDSDGDY